MKIENTVGDDDGAWRWSVEMEMEMEMETGRSKIWRVKYGVRKRGVHVFVSRRKQRKARRRRLPMSTAPVSSTAWYNSIGLVVNRNPRRM